MELLVLLWLVLAIATGAAANARGRSGFGWFVLAVFISPLLALILLIAFPVRSRVVGNQKVCQFCRSHVPELATVCAHCQREIDTPAAIQERVKDREYDQRSRRFWVIVIVVLALIVMAIGSNMKP